MPEIGIWQAAELLLDCHGEQALAIAMAQLDEALQSQDSRGVTDWTRVVTVIEKMTLPEKDPNGRKHR